MDREQTDAAKATILIVDDVPANLNLMREALEPEGYEILGAPSGRSPYRSPTGSFLI